MKHLQRLEDCQLDQASLVTIGVFDGVHRGHQTLISRLVAQAHRENLQAVVLTFFPHPDIVLRSLEGRYYLTSPEQRAALLGQLGVDVVITQSFDEALRTIRAMDFVDKLLAHLKMQTLCVGTDFALGYKREGNVAYLTELGQDKGYQLEAIDLVADEGGTISSTTIRQYLLEGKVDEAAMLLGRSYSVQGIVIKGDQRGRTIGFPTANMAVWEEQVLPAYGVYAGWASLGNERFMAVANVGIRPTFAGKTVTVEPHLLDFDRDIYGETLSLTFEKRLRGEQKFDGIAALKAQLQQDIQAGREFLSKL